MYKAYWLTNVTLDSGYVYEDGSLEGTETALYNIRIKDGVIEEMQVAQGLPLMTDLPVQDAKKLLALPLLKRCITILIKPI